MQLVDIILTAERIDDSAFWQSLLGSREEGLAGNSIPFTIPS
jgi:hypothetical protein